MSETSGGWARILAAGLVAGVVGAWVKNALTTWLYEREDPAAREREDAVRGDEFAYETAVSKVAHTAGRDVDDGTVQKLGSALHWGLGVGSVLLYAALRARWPKVSRGHGLAFGLPFTWLLLDEVTNPALGLTPPPQEFPWQTHARGLAGHTALWLTAETVLDAVAPTPVPHATAR